MSRTKIGALTAMCALAGAEHGQGQCVATRFGFQPPGIPIAPQASLVFDDGSGDELFVAGSFLVAGDVVANGIAKWNGARWAALGSGVDAPPMAPLGAIESVGVIGALAAFDDGTGPALYAGGRFTSIGGVSAANLAKWDGSAWSAVGGGVQQEVLALAAFDDGSGAALFVGGDLQSAGGMPVGTCAKWSGSTWTSCPGASVRVQALRVCDLGNGPELFGAGLWSGGSTGVPAAKWNGTSWVGLLPAPSYLNMRGTALEAFDDGSGTALYVGNDSNHPALWKWRSGTWTSVAGGWASQSRVRTLRVYDDGSGPALYAGGDFFVGSIDSMARWNGSAWSSVGAGSGLEFSDFLTFYEFPGANVTSLEVYDDGSGERLYAFGELERADGANVSNVARYDAGGWSALAPSNAPTQFVTALHAFDDGNGDELYVAGAFENAGPVHSPALARWDGASWSAMGVALDFNGWTGQGRILAMAHFDSGSGQELYIGGNFDTVNGTTIRTIARWNGSSWSPLGSGIPGNVPRVNALALYDDGAGEALYAAGHFANAGGLSAGNIAKWNGSSWSAPPGLGHDVYATAVFDAGGGDKLYAGGHFSIAGGVNASRVAAWNGVAWSALGPGLDGDVFALAVHDDGNGPALYAGGEFVFAGATFAPFVARWNGASWSPVGVVPSKVYALQSFDAGSGSALYAVARNADGSDQLLRWNGAVWTSTATIGGTSYAIAELHSAAGPELYVGGWFSIVAEPAAANLAAFALACTCPPLSYCTAGTSSNGCTPHVSSSGTPSASGSGVCYVAANGVDGQKLGLLFYGVGGAVSSPWGASSSVLCVKPPQQRTGQQSSGGTSGLCDGAFVLDFNAYVASHPTSLGQPFLAGDTLRVQGWYRDPPSPKTTSLTDALELYLCP